MNVNKSSWHYRLLKASPFCQYDMPRTICTYFWSLVALITLIVLAIPGTIMIPFMIWYEPFMLYVKALNEVVKVLFIMSATVGVIVWGCAILVASFGIIYYTGEFFSERRKRANLAKYGNVAGGPDVPREPGLISTWYKGFKEKYCTLINYTE
jgi:hypothetical protein